VKPLHLAMGAAVLVLGGLVLFGDKNPPGAVVEPIARSAPPRSGAAPAASPALKPAAKGGEPVILALAARSDAKGDTADGAGPFGNRDWNPPPPPPSTQQAAPPPPPSAPPLPFTFVGKAASEGQWEVFLARADKTYIVRTNMVIDGTYRVDAIAPPTLTLTYLPLNQVQQLNIGVFD
jgi:hypothetical protein